MDPVSANSSSDGSVPYGGTPSGLAPDPPSDVRRITIDVHTHLWDSLDQLGTDAAKKIRKQFVDTPWDQPDTTLQAFDHAMELVEYAIILGLECQSVGVSIPADRVARYVAREPEKYFGFAGIDPTARGYLSKVSEAVDLGMVGVTISPAAAGFHPTDSRAMRLYEKCQERSLPIVVHSGTHFGSLTKLEYSQPYLYDEVARAYPELKLVLAGVGFPWVEQTLILIGKHAHCYADMSDVTSRPWQLYNVLLLAHQQGVMDGLLFGSDYPFTTPGTAIHNIYSVNTVAHGTHLPIIPREQLRCVVERDALACLGLIPVPSRSPRSSGGTQERASVTTMGSAGSNTAPSD